MSIEELLEDLKQFITTTVSQATAELRGEMHAGHDKLRSEMKVSNDKLRSEMKASSNKLSGQIFDLDAKVDTIAVTQAEQINDHDLRLTRLEPAT
jgi:cell division septum initiation protein DivIVA